MFIKSGLILEAGEILFRDFWSLFGTSFYFFLRVIYLFYLKKTRTALPGRTRAGLRSGAPL